MKKRPRDPNALAKAIVGIATGQVEDRELTPEEQGKDPAAAALGRKGGTARAKKLSAKKRSETSALALQNAPISRCGCTCAVSLV